MFLPDVNPGFTPSSSFAQAGLGLDLVCLKWLHSAKICPHFVNGVNTLVLKVQQIQGHIQTQTHTRVPVSLGHCDRNDTGGLAAAVA